MANGETTQNIGNFKVSEMPQSTDPQIVNLTGRVDRLETDVHDIKAGVKELLGRPQNPGFNQVIGTLLATLAACAIIFGFAKFHLFEAITPLQDGIATLKTELSEARKYSEENRVQNAVMQERSRWLEAQSGWKATTK